MPDYTATNIFYFRRIMGYGGTEQFLYEIAKRYHQYDIAILYDEIEFSQWLRLSKLVRCIRRRPGQTYTCEKAFYNYEPIAINQIEAKEHIFVCHAIYQSIGITPPLKDQRITRYMGVSQYACKRLEEKAVEMGLGIKTELCYNPLTIKRTPRLLKIVSACRLNDPVKGAKRVLKLAEALDRYCENTGESYIWHIFSAKPQVALDSPNVIVLQPRVEIEPYIADADWLVQLSDDEAYCYSIHQAWTLGTGVVRTPFKAAEEAQVSKNADLVCEFDMSNVEDIAKRMFKPPKKFTYKAPESRWYEFLTLEPRCYRPKGQKARIKPIRLYYDVELGQQVSSWTPAWEVDVKRAQELSRKGLVRVLE